MSCWGWVACGGISQGVRGTQHPSLLCPIPMDSQEGSRPPQGWGQFLWMLLEQGESLVPTGFVSDGEMLVQAWPLDTVAMCLSGTITCDTPLSLLTAMSELHGGASCKPGCHRSRARGFLGTTTAMIRVGKGMGRGHPPPNAATPRWGEGGGFPAPFLPPPPLFSPPSLSNASGNLVIQEVAIRPLTQDMLLHEVCHPWDA